MEYFKVPWDSTLFGMAVAEIRKINIDKLGKAEISFDQFKQWLINERIEFCTARVPHADLLTSLFLEAQGFRFIELNYQPVLTSLPNHDLPRSPISIVKAELADQSLLADAAGQVYGNERFHKDPAIDPNLADERYRRWMTSAFKAPDQTVYKCIKKGKIVGFFVVEMPEKGVVFWSLIGILPQYQGKGIGKQAWVAMLDHHQKQGAEKVYTSLTSRNTAVFNLYVALGFRFPEPNAIFHWAARR